MNGHVRKKLLDQLENECERLHNSTRTDIPFLSPVHNYLRSKSEIYYRWSSNPKSPTVHKAGVLGFFVSLLFFTALQLIYPNLFIPELQPVLAGANSVTWTNQADFENNKVLGPDFIKGTADDNTTGTATTRSQVDTTISSGDVKLTVDTGTGAQGDVTISTTRNINEFIVGYNPDAGVVPNFNNLTITSTGVLTTSQLVRLEFKAKGTLTIQSGGKINASGLGYSGGAGSDCGSLIGYNGNGPGAGGGGGFIDYGDNIFGNSGGGGGGYGGYGGAGGDAGGGPGTGGGTYSSFPNFGSGGGGGASAAPLWCGTYGPGGSGGSGGGAIKIRVNSLNNNGEIHADGSAGGTAGSYSAGGGGGGGGGNIYIISPNNISVASLYVNGGSGSNGNTEGAGGGGGGGGRIVIETPSVTGSPSISGDSGGSGPYANGSSGSSGVYTTIYPPYTSPGTISGLKINAGTGVKTKWNTISWAGSTPSGTAIKFRTRGADTEGGLASAGWSSYYTTSGSSISTSASQWLEIETTLEGGTNTPTLNDFTVVYDTIDAPGNPKQYRSDGSTELTTGTGGQWTNESLVNLKADVTSAIDNPSTLTPQIEMNTTGTFTGTPGTPSGVTYTPSNINYAGSPISQAAIGSVSGLSAGNTYYWKVRYTDGAGRVSAWSTTSSSFSVEQTPPTGTVVIAEPTQQYINTPNVTLNLTGADTGGSSPSATDLKVIFSNDGVKWGKFSDLDANGDMVADYSSDPTHWESYPASNTYSWRLKWASTADDGSKTVYAQFKDNAGNLSSQWLQTSDADFNAGTKTDVVADANGLKLGPFSDPYSANYINGLAGTPLEGKQVYNQDHFQRTFWKYLETSCRGPQCATGLDPSYPSNYSLVADNSIDFSEYYARNSCKNWGGRLPNMQELSSIYSNRTSYGNNFQAYWYWSSTEYDETHAWSVRFTDGYASYPSKQTMNPLPYSRCVRAAPPNFVSSGNLVSSIKDNSTSQIIYSKVSWNETIPAGTSLSIQVRAGNTAIPDGSWTAWSTNLSNNANLSAYNGNRYIQYKATLNSNTAQDQTPRLEDIAIESFYTDSITLDTQAPGPPATGLSATPNLLKEGNVSLSWDAATDSNGIKEYKVYRSKDGGTYDYVATVTSPTTSYTDTYLANTGVSYEGRYLYQVSAIDNALNEGAKSSDFPAVVSDRIGPNIPSSVTAIPASWTNTTFTFNFTASDPQVGTPASDGALIDKFYYKVDSAPTGEADSTLVELTPDADPGSGSVSGVTAPSEGPHTFYVVAKDTLGNINWANAGSVNFYYDATGPNPSSNFRAPVAEATTTTIQLYWDAASDQAGITNYIIKRKKSGDIWGGPTEWTSPELGAVTSYLDSNNLESGYKYNYKIQAKDGAGNWGNFSADIDGYTIDTVAPSDPSGVSATPTASGPTKGYEIKLSWTAASDSGIGVAKYKIWRRAVTDDTREVNNNGYDVANPQDKIWTLVGVLHVSGPVLTEWYDNDLNNDALDFDGDPGNGNDKTEASLRLNDYVNYYYRIAAVDGSGNHTKIITTDPIGGAPNNTNYATGQTPDVTAPSVPSAAVTTMGIDDLNNTPPTQRLDITWSASSDPRTSGREPAGNGSGIKEYKVFRAKGNVNGPTEAFAQITTVTSPSTTYSDKGLDEFTYYYYKISAVDNAINESNQSSQASARTASSAVPTVPTNVTVTSKKGNTAVDSEVGHKITISFYGSYAKNYMVDKYEIYRSETNWASASDWLDPAKATKVTTLDITNIQDDRTNTRTFNDTNLTDSTTYYYKVRALDTTPVQPDNGPFWSGLSSINLGNANTGWDTTPDATAPQIPQEVKLQAIWGANPGDIRLVITWQKIATPTRNGSNDFKEYRLFKSTDNVTFSQVLVGSQNPLYNSSKELGMQTNYYVDSDVLTSGTHYYYYVVSVDDAGEVFKYPDPPYAGAPVINSYNNVSQASAKVDLNPQEVIPEVLTLSNSKKTQVTSVGVSSATVYWETNQPTESVVAYRKAGTNDEFVTTGKEGLSTTHSVTLRALEAGTTYEYRVSGKNTIGNDRKVGAGTDDTNVAPLATSPFGIANTGAVTTTTTATITWTTDVDSDSNAEYKLQKNPGESEETSKTAGDPALTSSHSVTIKALKPGRTYIYKIRSVTSDKYVAETGFLSFQTKPFDVSQFIIAPTSSRIAEQNITATSAKITWVTEVPTTSWVEYSTQSGTYTQSSGSNDLTKSHVVELLNLTPNTLYYYRVKGKDQYDIEYISQEYSFRALAQPEISNLQVREVAPYSAVISWSTNIPTDSGVNYSTETPYASREQSADLKTTHQISLKDLTDQTTYHFQVEVKDEYGHIAKSEDKIFTTPLDTEGPKISEVKISPLAGADSAKRGVIITWMTNKEATAQVEYSSGVTPGKYDSKSPVDPNFNLSHTIIISDLEPGTTYHMRLISKDKRGNEGKSADYTMLTQEKEESILNLILRTLEETFSWVGKVKDFLGQQFRRLIGR